MNTKIVNALLFAGGAAIGSIVTWQLVKETYRKIALEEIQAVRDYYKGKYDGPQQSEPTQGDTENRVSYTEPTRSRFDESVREEYETLTQPYIPYEAQGTEYTTEPYVISPDEYGNCEGFTPKSLIYYADHILADAKTNQIVQDAEMVVGDFEEHIGDYEDDAVHIRNEWNMTDYEILCSEKNYSDVPPTPHQMEVEWGDEMN